MNPEEVTQIIETIKTMNLNVDSQTLVEVTEKIKPIIMFMLIKDAVLEVLGLVTIFFSIFVVVKGVMKVYKSERDKNRR